MVAGALGCLLAVLPVAARAATPTAQQIAALNVQRVANGIPAGIVEVPAWTQACHEHMDYIADNGGVLTHDEDPSKPGYTPEGAAIGNRSVLTPLADAFDARGNAFEFAPLHLMQTLEPALTKMGVWGGCATTLPGFDRKTSRPLLFTYPGNGANDVYVAEKAAELPFVPGDFAGLPQGTTTGPYLLVMSLGTDRGTITSARLASPAGPVAIRTVDNTTDTVGLYMPPGGMIIPISPLARDTTYTASVTFQAPGAAPLSRTWTFDTTVPGPPATSGGDLTLPATLSLVRPHTRGRSVAFTLLAAGPLVGRRAAITTVHLARRCAAGRCRDVRSGHVLRSVLGSLAANQTITAPRPARGRTIEVRVRTQPFESAGLSYPASVAVVRFTGR